MYVPYVLYRLDVSRARRKHKLSCELHLRSFASAALLKDVLRVLLYRIYFKNKPSVSCKNESEQVFNRFPSKIKC